MAIDAQTTYDQLPYRSVSFPQTHPDRLATIARMFGLSPPDVARCRVLELGCASGGNLLPMACHLPASDLVGIDLSRRQVDEGQAAIRGLGLRNVRIEQASILDINADWGLFDYIICHGVFSWVERPVQDKILEVMREHLSPTGIAYVSYNTYPGWHMREMVRHMMRYHAGTFDTPEEQIEQARALLAFLASTSEGSGPYGELLAREVERLSKASDSYLFHEHLEQTNTPIYFHQFIERAERAGLLYLSEASVSDMLTAHFPSAVAETLERISPDILHLEQYMDFVRNRQFRQTLLAHAAQKPRRALTPAFLHGLLASSRATPDVTSTDLTAGTTVVFRRGLQRADVTLPATKAALTVLRDAWPEAVAIDELCATALEQAAPFLDGTLRDEAPRSLMGDLFGAVMYGMVQLHTQPPACTNAPSERPRAHALAAYQAEAGSSVVNAHHETIELDALSRQVLRLADGRRTRQDMLAALLEAFDEGVLVLEQDGEVVAAPEAAHAILSERLTAALAGLTRNAVLVAPPP